MAIWRLETGLLFNIISGIPRIEVGGFGMSALSAISLANWHHLAATYEGVNNTLKLYVDGVLVKRRFPKCNCCNKLLE